MPKEDYLLKYLEKLNRALAAMVGLRGKGFPEEALRLADETYTEFFELNLVAFSNLPVNDFIELLNKMSFTPAYLEALAKITNETAKCYTSKGDMLKMRIFSEKALLLYKLLNQKDKTFSFEREMVISELEQILNL
jgi:hypothetical protein